MSGLRSIDTGAGIWNLAAGDARKGLFCAWLHSGSGGKANAMALQRAPDPPLSFTRAGLTSPSAEGSNYSFR
jgi:hypothetical protein